MIACWFHLGDPPGYAESIAYKSPNQTVCYQWCWPLLLLLLTSRMHQYSVPQSLVRPTFLGTDMQRTLRAIPRHITHARLRTRTSQHKKWAQLFLKTDLFVGGKQTNKATLTCLQQADSGWRQRALGEADCCVCFTSR